MPAVTTPPEPLSADAAARLADFARAVKAAARAVSLYPATHPSIQASLSRVLAAAQRLTAGGDITLTVHPDAIAVDGREAPKPDASIAEVAELLHDRLIGELTVPRTADVTDWQALLFLLAKSQEDLAAEGGIGKAWSLTGRAAFEIREIDYAEVLRERAGGDTAAWDRIIANCLSGDAVNLDERNLSALLDLVGDQSRFGDFLSRLQSTGGEGKLGARAAALLQIMRSVVSAIGNRNPGEQQAMLGSMAAATSRLTPEMMLALVSHARAADRSATSDAAAQVIGHIGDRAIASFVAGNVVAERGATSRLAQAFEALVPVAEERPGVVEAAHEEARQSPLGGETGFEDLWTNAASMLLSYSDKPYVSEEYARELSDARSQAIDVERVSDDPPERIQEWLSTISDAALRILDVQLLRDLLTLERDPDQWRQLAGVVAGEIERLTLLGDAAAAQQLLEPIARDGGDDGREAFRGAATALVERLASGALVRHIVLHLRTVEEHQVEPFGKLCYVLGPIVIRPLAEALANEENNRALRRLRELLLGFGAAGRHSVEQLKNSPNPAVRRTAIDLLRVFGGREALPELASMLDDADPQVQRDAIRAIVQIGTNEAYEVLERALVSGGTQSRDTIVQQLMALRDEKAVPLLCYVLNHTAPRGRLLDVHLAILDSLGALPGRRESIDALKAALFRVEWWAPFRAARIRHAAAISLRRIGSPEAVAVLEDASARGGRSVRNTARSQIAQARPAARERVKS